MTQSKAPSSTLDSVCERLWSKKGKRMRARFVNWFGALARVAPEDLEIYYWAVEALHTATLLHDDVVDEAKTRRGVPTANETWGNAIPVLAGDYLLSDVVYQLSRYGNQRILQELCLALRHVCVGECQQKEMQFRIPDTDEFYSRIAFFKTSALFRWAASVGPILNEKNLIEPSRNFANAFGNLFQFTDDYLDVYGASDKESWTDLKEGKLNSVTYQLIREDADLFALVNQAFEKREYSRFVQQSFKRSANQPSNRKRIYQKLMANYEAALGALLELPPGPVRRELDKVISLCTERCH